MVGVWCSLWRLLGYVVIMSATASLANSITNMALHRPCDPLPSCSTLFDDDVATTFQVRNGVDTSEVAPTDAISRRPRTRISFRVYLEHPVYVANVVIVCVDAPGKGKRFLHSDKGSTNSQNAIHSRHRGLRVITWMDSNITDNVSANESVASKGHASTAPITSSDSSKSGILTLVFKVEQPAAVIGIDLERSSDSSEQDDVAVDADDSVCGEMRPAEVAVGTGPLTEGIWRAHKPLFVENVPTSRRLADAVRDQSLGTVPADIPTLRASTSSYCQTNLLGAVQGPAASITLPLTAMSPRSLIFVCVSSLLVIVLAVLVPWLSSAKGRFIITQRLYTIMRISEDEHTSGASSILVGDPSGSPPLTPYMTPMQGSSESELEMEPLSTTKSLSPKLSNQLGRRSSGHTRSSRHVEEMHISFRSLEDVSRGSRGQHGSWGGVILLYASPLCSMDPRTGSPIPMEQIPFERERDVLVQAKEDASIALRKCLSLDRVCGRHRRPGIPLKTQPLTSDSLQRVLSSTFMTVLHLSAHGNQDCLVLDNGKGTAHYLSCRLLDDILDLRNVLPGPRGLRLVVVNACSSRGTGSLFASCGIPHVICTIEDIHDSMSLLFLRTLYLHLFRGATVIGAFEAATVALRSNSVPYSNAFCLLPENSAHDEVLFPLEALPLTTSGSHLTTPISSKSQLASLQGADSNSGSSSDAETLPLERYIPPPHDDFVGRILDIWKVLQYLNNRRAVVVCGVDGSDHGIGKSAVLDAVHRKYTHQRGVCVASKLRSLSLLHAAAPTHAWIEKVRNALRNALQELHRGCRHSYSPPTSTHNAASRSLSGTDLAREALHEVFTELDQLTRTCEERRHKWYGGAVAGVNILLIFDECDHLIQQRHFQDSLAEILHRYPQCRILMSTQQPMVRLSDGQFKVVHHALEGLAPRAAVRLFLSRMHRPLLWRDLIGPANGPITVAGVVHNLESPVVLTKQTTAEVIDFVSRHAGVSARRGNPRNIITLANTFGLNSESFTTLQRAKSSPCVC